MTINLFIFPLQEKRRILTTDEWLRVKGCSNVYALGDCASIDQRKVMVKKPCTHIFNQLLIYTVFNSLSVLKLF